MLPPVKLFINKINYSTFCMYLYEYHLFNLVNLQISSRLCFWFYSILWKNMQCCSVEYIITNSSWQFCQNGSFWTGRSLQTYYMDLSFALVQFSFLERLTGQYQVHLWFNILCVSDLFNNCHMDLSTIKFLSIKMIPSFLY